jgi:hypothetical protein
VINGFWLNQTGLLEITIEYEPQRWFYYGLVISITTFIACIGYLAYNWRGEKLKIKNSIIGRIALLGWKKREKE